MIHEDLDTIIDGIKFEDARLVHEHYLVPAGPKALNHFVICSITCVDCYCNICGKSIKHFHVSLGI